MTFQASVCVYMLNLNRQRSEMARYQNAPVALDGVGFRAHQPYAKAFAHAIQDPLDALPKKLGPGNSIVLHLAVPIAGCIVAARTQFPAKKGVPDASIPQSLFQCFSIELRIETTVWIRSDVAKRGDLMLTHEGKEACRRVCRVSNGVNGVVHGGAHKRGVLMTAATSL